MLTIAKELISLVRFGEEDSLRRFLWVYTSRDTRARVTKYTSRLEAAVLNRYPLKPASQIDGTTLSRFLRDLTGLSKIDLVFISCRNKKDEEAPVRIEKVLGEYIYQRWSFQLAKQIGDNKKARAWSSGVVGFRESMGARIHELSRAYLNREVGAAIQSLDIHEDYSRYLREFPDGALLHQAPLSYWIGSCLAENHAAAQLFESYCYQLLDCLPIGHVEEDNEKWMVLCE